MSTSFVGDITHIPFMNASTTGMCVLQTTDEVDIGGHYNSTLEQGQCFVLTLLTLPQTAPTRMSNVGHARAAIGQSEGRCPLTCTGHPPCHTPPRARHTPRILLGKMSSQPIVYKNQSSGLAYSPHYTGSCPRSTSYMQITEGLGLRG